MLVLLVWEARSHFAQLRETKKPQQCIHAQLCPGDDRIMFLSIKNSIINEILEIVLLTCTKSAVDC